MLTAAAVCVALWAARKARKTAIEVTQRQELNKQVAEATAVHLDVIEDRINRNSQDGTITRLVKTYVVSASRNPVFNVGVTYGKIEMATQKGISVPTGFVSHESGLMDGSSLILPCDRLHPSCTKGTGGKPLQQIVLVNSRTYTRLLRTISWLWRRMFF
jgi:hypothetical protein